MAAIPVGPAFSLASVSWQPADPSPAAVFAPIAGSYRRVFAYNACDASDPWKLWDPANPGASDLLAIGPANGFWIEGIAVATLPEGGAEPEQTTIPLCAGWNLVGFPAASPQPVASALASIAGRYLRVFGFDAADAADPWEVYDVVAPAWANDLTQLRPGRGYWIYATEAADLQISNEEVLPVATIISPADLAEITGPTPIVATVRSPNLESWRLEWRLVGEPDWIEVAAGTTPIEAQAVATFDPTLLENGLHEIRLFARDLELNTVEETIALSVEGQRKIGQFSLAFVDLEIPLSGVPIQVVRSYDSRRRGRAGEFGHGWELELRSGTYRTNRPTGEGWHISAGMLPCDTAIETRSHLSTVRLSDREIYRFRPILTQLAPGIGGCFGVVGFAFVDGPVPGATLSFRGPSNFFWENDSSRLLDLDGAPFNPGGVRLATRDGRVFELDRAFGVTKAIDVNGNSITFSPSGIAHSDGLSISFTRDAANRIVSISSPGNADLEYDYDAAGDLVAFTDRSGEISRYVYSAGHYLEEIEDPRGITPIRNEYGPDGRLLRHVDANGQVIEYDHQLSANREVVTNRLGGSKLLEYDARGNVILEVDESGVTMTRTFDADDQLLAETDESGNTTSYGYDANRNLTSTTDPLGRQTQFTYDARGNLRTVRDPRGGLTTNEYDANGNLIRTIDPLAAVTQMTYSSKGLLLSETDAQGNSSSFAYDSRGRLIRETDAQGTESTFTYSTRGDRLSEARPAVFPGGGPELAITQFSYDAQSRLISTTAPDGSVTRTEYDVLGNVTAAVDALGRRTELQYDDLGRHVRTNHPDGTYEESGYDAENRRISARDRGGRTTTYEYDPAGRLLRTVFPDGSDAEQIYDNLGRLERTIDPRGNETVFGYDGAGRRTSIADALGRSTTFTYDAAGNQIGMTDARGATTVFVYDAGNRLIRTVNPDGTSRTTAYDVLGRRVSETDESGRATSFGYDSVGRLTAVQDALGQLTYYGYDSAGNRVSQTDANGRTTYFEYDLLGRQTKRILPDGAEERFAYDESGNRTSRTDFRNRTTLYDYDAANRLIRRTSPGGIQELFTYTPTGRRLTATDARGTTTYGYDSRDRLTSLVYPDGRSLGYSYDAAGNRATLTANVGGRELTTSYTYDVLNRLDTVTDPIGGVYDHNYDENGNRESLLYPNGVATTYDYNARNQLTQISTVNGIGTTLLSFAYTLAPTGNRIRITEHDGVTRHYAYDALYRLTDEHVRNGVAADAPTAWRNSFTYDPVGNRLQQTRQVENGSPQPVIYTYDTRDRLLVENGASLVDHGWDANGNLIQKTGSDGATYLWDDENRLTRVTLASGTVVEHTYDVDGTRVRTRTTPATGPPTTIDYLVDPWHQTSAAGRSLVLSQVVAESDGATMTAYHVRGDDLLGTLRPESGGATSLTARYFHAEGIGTIRALTDEAGEVTDRYTLEAFGTVLSHEGDDPNAYLFAGEPLDPNSGFYYNRARWLDPNAGRFASFDPFGGSLSEPSSLHRYLYVSGHPQDGVDPTGLMEGFSGLATSMAIGGLINGITTAFFSETAGPDYWQEIGLSVVTGAIAAPVGGMMFKVLGKAVAPLIKQSFQRLFTVVGQMNRISLRGKTGVEALLVRMSRFFVNTNRTYPRVGDTLLGRVLKLLFPRVEWNMHHVFIQQSWSRVGSGAQIFDDLLANRGLQRVGNGLWNLLPIPASLNRFLGNTPVGTALFATAYYGLVAYGTHGATQFLIDVFDSDE